MIPSYSGSLAAVIAPAEEFLVAKLSCRGDDFVIPTTGEFLAPQLFHNLVPLTLRLPHIVLERSEHSRQGSREANTDD